MYGVLLKVHFLIKGYKMGSISGHFDLALVIALYNLVHKAKTMFKFQYLLAFCMS